MEQTQQAQPIIYYLITIMKDDIGGHHHTLRLENCKLHLSATRPGRPLEFDKRCQCCFKPILKQQLKFNFKEEAIAHCGQGPILFFRLSLFALILFVCLSALFSGYLLWRNSTGLYCDSSLNNQCSPLFVVKLSWINASSKSGYVEILIGCCAILFVAFIGATFGFKKMLFRNDSQTHSYYPNDYSILLRLRETDNYTEQDIKKILKEWWEVEMKILHDNGEFATLSDTISHSYGGVDMFEKIYFHFNIEMFEAIKKELRDLQVQIGRPEGHSHNDPLLSSHTSTFRSVMSRINRVEEIKMALQNRDLQKTNKCIVTFTHKKYARFFKQQNRPSCFARKVNRIIFPLTNEAEVLDAPYPFDTHYFSQHLPTAQKRRKRALMGVASLMVLLLGAGLVFSLVYLSFSQKLYASSAYSPILALLVFLISSLSCGLCSIFAKFELQPNANNQYSSAVFKVSLTGTVIQVVPLACCFCLLYSSPGFAGQGGYLQTIAYLCLYNCLLPHLGKIINFQTIYQCCQRSSSQGLETIDQITFNQMNEKPAQRFDIQCSWLLTEISLTLFVAPLAPSLLILTAISLALHYLFSRLGFVYIYKQPEPSDRRLFLRVHRLMVMSGFWLGAGLALVLYEEWKIRPTAISWWMFAVAAAISILSLLTVFISEDVLVPWEEDGVDESYQEAHHHFIHTYEDSNPAYHSRNVAAHFLKDYKCSARSQALLEELNTMSKSLEGTLKDRLFKKTPAVCLENLGDRPNDSSSMYYEYDIKVRMPERRSKEKLKVPPIFKPSSADKQLVSGKPSEKQLVKINWLFTEEDEEVKARIKEAIKGDLKIKNNLNPPPKKRDLPK